MQDLRIANRTSVDKFLCFFDVCFGKTGSEILAQIENVASDDTAAQWHDQTRADFSLSTLFRSQPVSECLKYMKRNGNFSVAVGHVENLTQID